MDRKKIDGVDIYSAGRKKLLLEIDERLKKNERFRIMSVNPEILMLANENKVVKNALKDSEINLPDGIGTVFIAGRRGQKIEQRLPGFELFNELCEIANENGYSIFLYGAEKWVVEQAAENLKKKFPELKISGTMDGFQSNQEEVVRKINQSKADFLFVALGAPRQESFINDYFEKLEVKIVQPVGGSFDVLAGKTKRAPKWTQKIHMEWFYRLMTDRKRSRRVLKMMRYTAIEIMKRR